MRFGIGAIAGRPMLAMLKRCRGFGRGRSNCHGGRSNCPPMRAKKLRGEPRRSWKCRQGSDKQVGRETRASLTLPVLSFRFGPDRKRRGSVGRIVRLTPSLPDACAMTGIQRVGTTSNVLACQSTHLGVTHIRKRIAVGLGTRRCGHLDQDQVSSFG
jgi:hypothetical protein